MNVTFLFGAGSEVNYNLPLGHKFIHDVIKSYATKYSDPKRKKFQTLQQYKSLYSNLEKRLNYNNLEVLSERFESFFEDEDYKSIVPNINSFSVRKVSDLIDEKYGFIDTELKKAILFPALLYLNTLYLINESDYSYKFNEEILEFEKLYKFKETNITFLTTKFNKILIYYLATNYRLKNKSIIQYTSLKEIDANANYENEIHKMLIKCLDIIDEVLSKTLDYDEFLLGLVVSYMKEGNLLYFQLCEVANDNLMQIQSLNPSQTESVYHYINRYFNNNKKFKLVSPFTANYTNYASDILQKKDIIHLHGKLDNYYNFDTKQFVSSYDKIQFNTYPYLILQSSVKAIDDVEMSAKYIAMFNQLSKIEYLIIYGLSLNPDDNHITNLLIKAINQYPKLKIIFLNYSLPSEKCNTLISKFENKNFMIHNISDINSYKKYEELMDEILISS